MKTVPFETGEGPVTPNFHLYEGTGTEHGKNKLVEAREGVFWNMMMFEYPGKLVISELPLSKRRRIAKVSQTIRCRFWALTIDSKLPLR
jgi:hypothetical protein